eukprot:TRINITY_DN54620_c0_g1_i1.p2 TRINITY_DN54620_c0_g1~~TRINITY_DN54620_c0_g1_i1.p2  ORF type:complete len:106 (+),score=7.88 TRINITY_DN54620_c0_g1_i1:42-359(+)
MTVGGILYGLFSEAVWFGVGAGITAIALNTVVKNPKATAEERQGASFGAIVLCPLNGLFAALVALFLQGRPTPIRIAIMSALNILLFLWWWYYSNKDIWRRPDKN